MRKRVDDVAGAFILEASIFNFTVLSSSFVNVVTGEDQACGKKFCVNIMWGIFLNHMTQFFSGHYYILLIENTHSINTIKSSKNSSLEENFDYFFRSKITIPFLQFIIFFSYDL